MNNPQNTKARVGSVKIYADTGLDQWQIVQDRIKKDFERKNIKGGQIFMMPVDFGEGSFVLEIKVREIPNVTKH